MAAPPAKRARLQTKGDVSLDLVLKRMSETKLYGKLPEGGLGKFICTHHGTFHADEVMACTMLKCLPEYADMPILRSRNQAEIDQAAVVVDVGGTYDPEKHRFDHHQNTFSGTYSEDYPGIKLSSAGQVYKHFASRVVDALCGTLDPKAKAAIISKTYDGLIRELDAIDNGVTIADDARYRYVTNLGARIGRLNPSWQEPSSPEIENERFKEATELAADELFNVICGYCTSWLPAREIVQEALSKRKEVHASGEIMKLPRFCPWQEHLFDLEAEEEAHREPLVKYVLFQDSRGGWRIQAAPKEKGKFENRLSLPKAWCGLRDKALDEVTEVPGGVFIHANGFIGGHTTEAGVIELAVKALAAKPAA